MDLCDLYLFIIEFCLSMASDTVFGVFGVGLLSYQFMIGTMGKYRSYDLAQFPNVFVNKWSL